MKADRDRKTAIRQGLARLQPDTQAILLEEFCLWGDRATLDNVSQDKLPELYRRVKFILYPEEV